MNTSLDREEANEGTPSDIRPIVAREAGNRPLWVGLGIIGLSGAALFGVLEARRSAATAPAVRARVADLAQTAPSPTLFVPPDPIVTSAPLYRMEPSRSMTVPPSPSVGPGNAVRPIANPNIFPVPTPVELPSPPQPAAVPLSSAIVYDATAAEGGDSASKATNSEAGGATFASVARARSVQLSNRINVVPQGTLIPAVLETALDSTQPGLARALVSSDVENLRGGRVLIPRGSHLFGSYDGALQSGQNRARIQWTRLVRPDGATVAIDSPASDRLGRAGVRGRVNTHFLTRVTNALLQSAIDVGTTVATQSVYDSPVLVAVPRSAQSATTGLVGDTPKPTLTIKQGSRISVFVMRDLDFSGVEGAR